MQAQRENKRVEVLGKFFDLITNSNMIGKGMLFFVHLKHFVADRQQAWPCLLRVSKSVRERWRPCSKDEACPSQ
jgi:hypothetical protein